MKEKLFACIKNSPTAFHATTYIKKVLQQNGFEEVSESQVWQLQSMKKYFVTRNDSSIIAFTTPKEFETLQIAATHLDSPTFKVKTNGEIVVNELVKLNVEKYGGMIIPSWFDRPLSLAGRMIVEDSTVQSRLFDIKEETLMIPNMAIHLQRDINDNHRYNVQKEVAPIISQDPEFSLIDFIKDRCGIQGEVLGLETFLYNPQEASTWGANKEFFSAPRIDNLECSFGVLEGFISSHNESALNMSVMFDNEEVGSMTKQGADSSFLNDVLERIRHSFRIDEQTFLSLIAKGFMISADNAHGYHPNYPEAYDNNNTPKLNQGIVIKHNANQKYTTDALSAAVFRKLCKKAKIPYQEYHNHSNVLGGSTLGNISNTHLSLNTVDIGLAQWAMHSAYESAGCKDIEYLVEIMKYYFENTIKIENGVIKF